METVLAAIGLFVLVKFCIKHRRLFMNRKAFCQSIGNLRRGIVKGWSNEYQHQELDNIVHNVLGEETMDKIEDLEENLASHIVSHIRAIKQAQENEKLKVQAEKIIEQIKSELAE